MTWTYAADPTEARDLVRFLLGDTLSDTPLLADEDIAMSVALETGVYNAAAACAESLAGQRADQVRRVLGAFSVNSDQKYLHWAEQAKSLRLRAMEGAGGGSGVNGAGGTLSLLPFLGGQSKADKQLHREEPDRVQPLFTREQFGTPVDPRPMPDTTATVWEAP